MADERIAVLGFGRTGKAMLDFLLKRKDQYSIHLFNDDPVADAMEKEKYRSQGVVFLEGRDAFSGLTGMDRIVLSPGIDARQPRFQPLREARIPILSEIEFAWSFNRGKIIAVSGTNGKSTTVSLIQHLLIKSGFRSHLAGNIGLPFISAIESIAPGDPVVLEISSFQLEEIHTFRPHVAVLLNITPDHLDRYPSMDDYIDAKLRIFENLGPDDHSVINADDPVLEGVAGKKGRGAVHRFSVRKRVENGVYLDGEDLVLSLFPSPERISLKGNRLLGRHNLENIAAAVLAARLAGGHPAEFARALAGFSGLPHRMECVGSINGIHFINDSKATNVDAALKSISGLEEKMVVILGGKDKGGDFSALIEPLKRKSEQVFLIGKAADAIAGQLQEIKDRISKVRDLEEAVDEGYKRLIAFGGGAVLLAPACASFDMFRDFEHRGEVFRGEVRRLIERITNG